MTSSHESRSRRHQRVRAVLYAVLSLVTLVALLNTGWARLGPTGFALTLGALLAARVINRPWLVRAWRDGGSLAPLMRDLAGQTALALVLFWLGFGLSHLLNWAPDFKVVRPAAVILIVGALRRWLFPPARRGEMGKAKMALAQALAAVPPEAATRHQLQEILLRCREGIHPDRYALQMIDRAEATARPSDRLAMVLAVTDPQQALACEGHKDLSRAFEVLRDGRDGEALLTYAVRATALLESRPETLTDLPRVEHLQETAQLTASAAAAAGLRALAQRIARHKDEMYSL